MTRSVGILLAIVLSGWASMGVADDAAQDIGLSGRYRIGHWMPVRVPNLPDGEGELAVATQDGGGAEVTYRQNAPAGGTLYAIPGTEAAELKVLRAGQTLRQTQLPGAGSPATGPALVPPATPLGLCFGDPLGIDQIGANEILNRDPVTALVVVNDAATLPDRAIGLDAVDYVVVTGRGAAVLGALSESQNAALADWLAGGGRVVATLGTSAAETLEAAPWLAAAVPLAQVSTNQIDPAALETFTNSDSPLSSFDAVALPRDQGQTLLGGRTRRRAPVPLVVRYAVGFGSVTVIAADLDAEPFADWPQRLDLLDRLVGNLYRPATIDTDAARRAAGFGDLAGQTRRTLDQFVTKRTIPFSIVALVVLGWIAVVGPIDALVVRQVIGRPLAGWATILGASVLLSAGLIFAAAPVGSGADSMSVRSMEFIDVDLASRYGRSTRWAVPFSHAGDEITVATQPPERWSPMVAAMSRRLVTPLDSAETLDGAINIDLGGTVAVSMQPNEDELVSQIDSLTLSPRGSRSVVATSQFTADLPKMTIDRRRGSELLRGALTNPLPVDLLEGMLIYKNWAYLLPTRLPAGGRIADVDTLRQKNFRWQLTRQKALQSASESQPWQVTDTDPSRLAEMLMFYDAAGGQRYTGLTHWRLRNLDLSHVLTDDRAILVGRTDEPFLPLSVQSTDEKNVASVQTYSFIRLVVPVASESRS